MKKVLFALLLAAGLAFPATAQNGSKIVTDATATGQTGAMQTGARAAGVTFTFCGTGFSGPVYVDAAATQVALAQVWTTTMAANSDCTTVYSYSPASKWYRVRWTRNAGTLNIWMNIQTGDSVAGALVGPVGGLTAGRVPYATSATALGDDSAFTFNTGTDALAVGSLTASNLTATRVPFAGAAGAIQDDAGLTYDPVTDTLGTGRILVGDGSAAAPSVAFAGNPMMGMSYRSGGGVGVVIGKSGVGFRTTDQGYQVISDSLGFCVGATTATGADAFVTRAAAATLQLGAANSASHTAVAQTLRVQSNITESDQAAPASFKVQGPNGTGNAAVQGIELQTGAVQASGATAHVPTTRLSVKELHINLRLGDVNIYANNAAALAGGLVAGDLYRTGADPDPVMIVH